MIKLSIPPDDFLITAASITQELILRCAWSACIYAIWKERNCRLNRDKEETKQQVLEQIVQMIRLKFANLRNIEADHVNIDLIKSWGLPQNIIA